MRFSGLPWWAKMMVKAGLALVPSLSYERIRSLLTGYRGAMENSQYADRVFHKFISNFQGFSSGIYGGTLLELGPGGSLFSGIFGRILGFDQCVLVDVGDFASRDPMLYEKMSEDLAPKDHNRFMEKLAGSGDVIEAFREIGVIYLTSGLSSLRQIPDNSISFSFSNAVLEHIRVKEFAATASELYRIHQTGAISIHQIDYKDHLSKSLNNLRFSYKVWESPFFPNSGSYTNRLRHQDVKNAFVHAGFFIERDNHNSWAQIPLSKAKMASEFQGYTNEELKICGGHLILKKSS